jgi:hypothetical protein
MTTTPSLLRSGIVDNATLTGGQADGAVIPSSDGTYFVVWLDFSNYNGGLRTVVGRHFDALGNALTGEVNLTPGFSNNEDVGALSSVNFLSAARLPISGQPDGFVVAFVNELSNGDQDVWIVRANASLSFIAPFPLDEIIASSSFPDTNPAITSFADGALAISYTLKESSTDPNTTYQTDWDIVVKTMSPSGVVSSPITIWEGFENPTAGFYAPGDLSQLATLANGNFVDVFQTWAADRGTFTGDADVFFTIKTEAGANVVSPAVVAGASTHFFEGDPHVAALGDGGFVVTYDGFAVDGVSNGYGVGASVYDINGGLVQHVVVETTQDNLHLPHSDVAALPDGGFIVSWEDSQTNSNRAQRFDQAGNRLGTAFIYSGASFNTNVAVLSDGRAIFTGNSGTPSDVVSAIWDTRNSNANAVTGHNFIGPGGSAGDILLVDDFNGVRNLRALEIENGATQADIFIGQIGTNVAIDGSGDFNHDGLSDLLLHADNLSAATRTFYIDQMTPNGVQGAFTLGATSTEWVVDAIGDFNGDATSDVLLHRDAGGARTFEVFSINNHAVQAAPILGTTGTDWVVDGSGDFNHDGTSDILLHHDVGGVRTLEVLSIVNNTVQAAPVLGQIGADWQVDGIGDFNHDGTSDILMHHDSGGVRTFDVLSIVSDAVQAAPVLASVGANVWVDGVGDFNNDGTSDIAVHADFGTGPGGPDRHGYVYGVVNDTIATAQLVSLTPVGWHPLGQAGSDGQAGAPSGDLSTASMASSGQLDQLVQAMAGFGANDATAGLTTVGPGQDPQQALLSMPQHG